MPNKNIKSFAALSGMLRSYLAATQGDENAIKARDIVADRMTADQIAEAQKLAREWKPTE